MALPKRPNILYQDKILDGAVVNTAIAATTTLPICTMDGDYRVEKFEVMAVGGYAVDPTNYYVITLQAGATVLATYSLLTGANGALTTLVFASGTLAANPTGLKGDQLNVVLTKNGAAVNFPAGSVFNAHLKQVSGI